MQTTFSGGLNPSFYGKQIRSGVPAYDNNGGIRTVGGYISTSNSADVKFGTPLFANTTTPNAFMGAYNASTAPLFVGWLINRSFVNEYSPAHADFLLNGTPADALYHGAIWITVPAGLNPTVGAKLYVDASTGALTLTSTSNIDIKSTVKEIVQESGTKYMLVMVEA
jgi:hypothetical protein